MADRRGGSTVSVISAGSDETRGIRGMSSAALAWSVTPRDGGQFWGQRMALAGSEDIARGLFLQSVLKSIRALGDESLEKRAAAACGQSRFFDFFNYQDRKSTRLNSSHANISYAVFCLKKKKCN